MASHRILYVGRDHILLRFLQDALSDCTVVRCPDGRGARPLIESDINYSLLLFDDTLPDTTGTELAQFARALSHRVRTPIVILSVDKARGVVAGLLFEKPYDTGSIVETITATLQHSKT